MRNAISTISGSALVDGREGEIRLQYVLVNALEALGIYLLVRAPKRRK
jgi:hypothetical protein